MTVREYIGARYVPLFMGEWDITKSYEPLSIVEYQGNSYTSRQSVPANVDIDNEVYWALTGNYNAQIEAYRQEVEAYDGRIDALEAKFDANGKVNTNLVVANSIADDAVTADAIADDAVTANAIADDAVTADAIADDAVNTVNIVDKAVTPAKVSDSLMDLIQTDASFRDNFLKRPLGSIPYPNNGTTYVYNQGCCIVDLGEGNEYLYALHSTGSGGDQYISRVNMQTGTCTTQLLPADMAHPNDITWNDKEETLVISSMVTTAESDVYAFYKYDFTTNAITERVLPSLPRFFTICWDSENERYISSRDSSPFTTFEIVFLDEEFNITSTVSQTVTGEFSNQAIDTDGQYIYQINFSKVGFDDNDGNSCFIYDMNGNFITSVYDNAKDMESEGIAYRKSDNSFVVAYAIPRHGANVSSLMYFKTYFKNEQVSDARLYQYSQVDNIQSETVNIWVNFARTNFYSDGSQAYPFKRLCEVSYCGLRSTTWADIQCSGSIGSNIDTFVVTGGHWMIHTVNSTTNITWRGGILLDDGAFMQWRNINVIGINWGHAGLFHIRRSVLDVDSCSATYGDGTTTATGNHIVYGYESRIIAGNNFAPSGSSGNPIYLFESFGSGPSGVNATKGGKTSAYNGAWL